MPSEQLFKQYFQPLLFRSLRLVGDVGDRLVLKFHERKLNAIMLKTMWVPVEDDSTKPGRPATRTYLFELSLKRGENLIGSSGGLPPGSMVTCMEPSVS